MASLGGALAHLRHGRGRVAVLVSLIGVAAVVSLRFVAGPSSSAHALPVVEEGWEPLSGSAAVIPPARTTAIPRPHSWDSPPLLVDYSPPPPAKVPQKLASFLYDNGFDRVVSADAYDEHVRGPERVAQQAGERGRYFTGWFSDPIDQGAPRHMSHAIPVVKELLRAAFDGTWTHVSGCSTGRHILDEFAVELKSIFDMRTPVELVEKEREACYLKYKPYFALNTTYYHKLLCECRITAPPVPIVIESTGEVDVADVSREVARSLLRNLSLSANTDHRERLCSEAAARDGNDGGLPCPPNVRMPHVPLRRKKVRAMVTYRWKETAFDAPYDDDLIRTVACEMGVDREPDVLVANAGIHAFHDFDPNNGWHHGEVSGDRLAQFFTNLTLFADSLAQGGSAKERDGAAPDTLAHGHCVSNPIRPNVRAPSAERSDALHPNVCVVWKGMNDYGHFPSLPDAWPGLRGYVRGRSFYRIMSRVAMEYMASRGAIVLDPNPFTENDVVYDNYHHEWTSPTFASEVLTAAIIHGCGVFGGIGGLPDPHAGGPS